MKRLIFALMLPLAACNAVGLHNPPTAADVAKLERQYAIIDAGILLVMSLPKCTQRCHDALLKADGTLYTALQGLKAWVNAPGSKGSAENILAKVDAAVSTALSIAKQYGAVK